MASATGRIAVVEGLNRDRVQALLANTAADWRAEQVRIAGLTARAYALPDRTCVAGTLYEVNSGEPFRISVDEPPAGTSCHLDADGVGDACAAVIDQIAECDVVILSKFGKLEAKGQGLFPAFAAAVASGKPVLTTVSSRHREAWNEFAPDAVTIKASKGAILDWWAESRA